MEKLILYLVKVNNNWGFPVIKDGWTETKDVFGFTDLQKITLSYVGNSTKESSLFMLVESGPLENFDQVPFYHSQAFIPEFTTQFNVQLSSENINKLVLVIKVFN
jgi:hypothetical protein